MTALGFGQALWRDMKLSPTIDEEIEVACPGCNWVWYSPPGQTTDIGTIMDEVERHLAEKHDGTP